MDETAARTLIGFVGVCVMGKPMASRLLKAGYPVTVYDLNPAPVEALVAKGAVKAASPTAAAQESDLFVSMVVNDAQLEAILFEPGDAAAHLKPGATVAGMSTMNRTTVQSIARRLQTLGVHYLDAPVSGGEKGVLAGTLTIMAGGPDELLESPRTSASESGNPPFEFC